MLGQQGVEQQQVLLSPCDPRAGTMLLLQACNAHHVPCVPAAVLVFLQHIMLDAILSGLRSGSAMHQKGGLRYLNSVLNLRRAFGDALVQQLLESGILDALVAVVKPDTDTRGSPICCAAAVLG
jgi:hypothetical protein